ncbi:MAG: hypothetical protein OHK006_25310 [Thermodesulfovibrionales bacterium]
MRKRSLKDIISILLHLLYHALVIAASASIVLSLPTVVSFVSNKFSLAWTFIENDKVLLLGSDIALALLIILFFHYAASVFRDRRLSKMARVSGLHFVAASKMFFNRWSMKRLKERLGISRDVMMIGSTGGRTFCDKNGDMRNVITGCREARIMLLNPYSEAAEARAKSILNPAITVEHLIEQVRQSIGILKELKQMQKNVRLKLYSEVPFLKLAISGDYVWFKHYHPGIDVKAMPEYVFRHNQSDGSLYTFFYQYFLRLWNSPDVPEYDLETDELVYRDKTGNEVRRVLFGIEAFAGAAF